MDARELSYVIQMIHSDTKHHDDRRILHENYEWLEHFWRYKYKDGDNSVNDFIVEKGQFFWNINAVRNLAREFASIECVGSNEDPQYAQTMEIARATMYLRYYCDLFTTDIPSCTNIKCRQHKIDKGFCIKENGLFWKRTFNPISSFRALVYIVRQVRNNLFHGHKLSLEPDQFERNKILVKLSVEVTGILLQNLIESETYHNKI